MGFAPQFFGCDGLDGILTMENFDASLAEGIMFLTPFAADSEDELTQNFVKNYQEAYGEIPKPGRAANSMRSERFSPVITLSSRPMPVGIPL